MGNNWYVQGTPTNCGCAVLYDTNYWKSFLHARLATPMGGKGAVTLFGDKAEVHQMFADHLCAELRKHN